MKRVIGLRNEIDKGVFKKKKQIFDPVPRNLLDTFTFHIGSPITCNYVFAYNMSVRITLFTSNLDAFGLSRLYDPLGVALIPTSLRFLYK
jgi:hypothetical protein